MYMLHSNVYTYYVFFVQHNNYECTGVSLPREDAYIVRYEPQADPRVVHHMLMFGCPGEVSHNTW